MSLGIRLTYNLPTKFNSLYSYNYTLDILAKLLSCTYLSCEIFRAWFFFQVYYVCAIPILYITVSSWASNNCCIAQAVNDLPLFYECVCCSFCDGLHVFTLHLTSHVTFTSWNQFTVYFTIKEQYEYASSNTVAEQVLSSIRTVIAFGGEHKESEKYVELL